MRTFALSLLFAVVFCVATVAQSLPRYRTILLHSAELGTQVIYLGSWGKTYLWHPSSDQIIPGRWSERASNGGAFNDMICLRYGGSDYNPLTGLGGKNPECLNFINLAAMALETIAGDPFALEQRDAVPFQLSSRKTSLAVLADKAGAQLAGEIRRPSEGVIRAGDAPPTIQEICGFLKNREIPENQVLCAEYW